jgi:hypothetical protein
MSIEYFGSPVPLLTDTLIESVLSRFRKFPSLIVLRDEPRSMGLDFVHLDPPRPGGEVQEAINIVLRNDEVYVAFRSGSGLQESATIAAIEGALQACGVDCTLVED